MDIYNCRVLLVDDNIELAAMIADILRRHGYSHVVSAISAREGLQVFEKEKPDIVILDVMLQDEDGFSLFKKYGSRRSFRFYFCLHGIRMRTGCLDWGLETVIISPSLFAPGADFACRCGFETHLSALGKNDRRGQDAEAWQQKGFL